MRRNIHGHCTRSINHAKGNIPILVARRIPVATTTRNAAAVAWGEPTGHGKHCGGARDGRIIPPRSVYRQSGNVLGVSQVPSQAPLLYDSSHADAPPHTMLRHSGSLHQIAEPNKPPRRYAIVELQIQQSTVTAAPLWHMRKAPLRTATETWGPYPPYRPQYRVLLPRVLKRARGAGTQPPVLRPAAHSTPRARTPPPGPPWPRHPSRHAACR